MTTPDQPIPAPCDVRYPSTDPTARIVHCGLPWRHDGDHCEEDGAPTWPRMPLAEAIVRTVAPTKADLERAEQAAYERGVAEGRQLRAEQLDFATRGAYEDGKGDGRVEGRRQATDGWDREWSVQYPDGYLLQYREDEAAARDRARAEGADARVVSRLVGPWEPAEPAAPVSHARGCVCGWNDAGQRFDDPICRRR